MSAWACPGVKCVCVDEMIPVVDGAPVRVIIEGMISASPRCGEVCLVIETEWRVGGLWLALQGYEEWVFEVRHFRPLITRTQSEDVALFRKLLVTEGADA